MEPHFITDASAFILVGLLWGATNPFLKKYSAGMDNVIHSNRIVKFILEMKYLATNWRYMTAFLINQSGAVVYYLTVGRADITLAVPMTNSLAFLFTALSGPLVGEPWPSAYTCIGGVAVMCGVTLCILSKITFSK